MVRRWGENPKLSLKRLLFFNYRVGGEASGHPMRAVEGAGAYRIRHPLGLHNAAFQESFRSVQHFL